jgi:hypothetical protein
LLVGAGVEIESPSGCPSVADVQAKLDVLVESKGPSTSTEHVLVNVAGNKMEVVLSGKASPTISRELAAQGSCSDRAWSVANIVARWETEIHHELVMRPPPAPPATPPPVEEKHSASWDIGAGIVAFVAGGVAFGGTVEAAVAPREVGLGVRAALTLATSRDQTLGMGSASWRRVAVSVGGRYRILRGRMCADVTVDAVGGFLSITGSGFATNMQGSDFDPGVQAGIKVGRTAGAAEYWLSASAVGWLREERLHVMGLSAVESLPRIEGLLGAGISWRALP